MPDFLYTAVDTKGAKRSGRIVAPDLRQASAGLRSRGLYATAISPAGLGPEMSTAPGAANRILFLTVWGARLRGRRARPKELALFTRQLATLTHAGMPLLRGL